MRVEPPKLFPLESFLDWIPEEGVLLTKEALTHIAAFFNIGGVICETHTEVLDCIGHLYEWYEVIDLETDGHQNITLRKA